MGHKNTVDANRSFLLFLCWFTNMCGLSYFVKQELRYRLAAGMALQIVYNKIFLWSFGKVIDACFVFNDICLQTDIKV